MNTERDTFAYFMISDSFFGGQYHFFNAFSSQGFDKEFSHYPPLHNLTSKKYYKYHILFQLLKQLCKKHKYGGGCAKSEILDTGKSVIYK